MEDAERGGDGGKGRLKSQIENAEDDSMWRVGADGGRAIEISDSKCRGEEYGERAVEDGLGIEIAF